MNRTALVVICLFSAGIDTSAFAQQKFDPQTQATIKRLSQDTAQSKDRIWAEAGSFNAAVYNTAKSESDAILAEGERVAADMRREYVYDGKKKIRLYSTEEIEAAKAKYKERAEQALNSGSARQRLITAEYNRRQKFLEESAKNLESQLTQSPADTASVILQPAGTSLYVRNYQSIGEMYQRGPRVQPARAVPQLGTYQLQPGPGGTTSAQSASVVSAKLLKAPKK